MVQYYITAKLNRAAITNVKGTSAATTASALSSSRTLK